MSTTDRVLSFGNYFDKPNDTTCAFTGLFDEVRLYDGVASADWIAADSDVKTELWVTPPMSVGLMILVQ